MINVAVAAPIGAKVPTLPEDNTEITVGSTTYYYYASTFYTPDGRNYVDVQPPIGGVQSKINKDFILYCFNV